MTEHRGIWAIPGNVERLERYMGEGVKPTQIARIFGISLNSAKKKIFRLRHPTEPKVKAPAKPKAKPEVVPRAFSPIIFRKEPERPSVPFDLEKARAAYLAKNKIRRFEPGCSGDIHNRLEWLRRECGITVTIILSKGYKKPFYMGHKRLSWPEFNALYDGYRKKRGLTPLARAA